MPSVSVIMTFFNEPLGIIKRSLYSILNQTFRDFEFIIISGNPENTKVNNHLRSLSLSNKQIVFHSFDRKIKMTECLNIAIKMAKGDYIAIQESDDESLPERLEKQYHFITTNPQYDIIGAGIAYIDEISKKVLLNRYYPQSDIKAFNKYTAIAHPTALCKKELYEKYGYYDETEQTRHSPDYDLWIRWILQGVKFYNIKEILFNYYQSENNGRNRNVRKTIKSVVRLKWKNHRKLSFKWDDYIYMTLEMILLLFPQRLVSRLFYFYSKLKRND